MSQKNQLSSNPQSHPSSSGKRRITANPFIAMSSPYDRLESWKELRRLISGMSDADALAEVAHYWSQAPLSNYSHNPEAPEDWPTPWELISRGDFSRHMLAVAMECTLRLSGWDSSRMQLMFLRDYGISEEVFVLKIDDKYALNYSEGEVVEYPATEQVITHIWRFTDKKFESVTY